MHEVVVRGAPQQGPKPLRVASWLLLGLVIGVGACTSDQRYGAVQTWQRQNCLKIQDAAERQRCLQQADLSRERYEQERDTLTPAR
jgi:flagellar motility protein MotE (MotC chaperone)